MAVKMEFRGGPTIQRKLKRAGDAMNDQAVTAALGAGGMRIVNRAQQLAPVLTGNLRRSIHMEPSPDRKSLLIGTDVEYAPYQEFGTSRMPAHPFLRPAFAEEKRGAVADAERAYRMMLQRAVQ